MKRMTRVINEDRKTGRPRFRFRFQRSSVVGDVRLWKNLWCVTRRERERGGTARGKQSRLFTYGWNIKLSRKSFFFPFHFLNMPLENATPSLVDLRLSLNSVSQIGILSILIFTRIENISLPLKKKNENNSSRLIVLLSIFFLFFNFLKYHWIFIDTIRFATRKAPSCVSSIKPNEAFLESIIAGY